MRLWVAFIAFAAPLLAHDPVTTKLTFTRDISRLLNRRCIGCHGANTKVPLTTFDETRPWAKAIRDQVLSRQMPPWGAVSGFGPDLRGDPSLTASELEIVVRWVEGGAPKGDDALLPHDKPPPLPKLPVLTGRLVPVACDWKAPHSTEITGIRPEGLGPANQMRVFLVLPGGAIVPVLWIHGYPPNGPDYVFEKPLALPAGAIVEVRSDAQATASLALTGGTRWLPPPETESRKQKQRCPAP